MSLIEDLRKFSKRSWQERRLFLEAFILLGIMRAAILLLTFQKITKILGLTQGTTSSLSGVNMTVDPTAIGWSIQAAAARTHWESACLAQALTGVIMLGRRGINSTLYLGVGKDQSDKDTMAAHAWLRCGESILTGAGGVERYSAISSFSQLSTKDNNRTNP